MQHITYKMQIAINKPRTNTKVTIISLTRVIKSIIWVCFKKEKKNHYYQLQKLFNLITSIFMRYILSLQINTYIIIYYNIVTYITNNINNNIIKGSFYSI